MSSNSEMIINTYYTPSSKDQDVSFNCVAGDYQIVSVLDGHGTFGKEFALKVKEKFIDKLSKTDFSKPIEQNLTKIFEETNSELYDIKYRASGCAATLVLISKTKIIVAHVGDSDAYLFDDEYKLVKLTQEHSLTTKSEIERILAFSKEKGIEVSITFATRDPYGYGKVPLWDSNLNLKPMNTNFHFCRNRMGEIASYIEIIGTELSPMLNMTRSIGDYTLKNAGIVATPNILTFERPASGSKLLVGSDGFWDIWTISELQSELSDKGKAKKIHETSVRQTDFYFGKGNGDDNTLMVLSL